MDRLGALLLLIIMIFSLITSLAIAMVARFRAFLNEDARKREIRNSHSE